MRSLNNARGISYYVVKINQNKCDECGGLNFLLLRKKCFQRTFLGHKRDHSFVLRSISFAASQGTDPFLLSFEHGKLKALWVDPPRLTLSYAQPTPIKV